MSDAIIRANRMKQAFDEDGGIKDVLDSIRKAYFERAGQLDPTLDPAVKAAALHSLSQASYIVQMVESHLCAIIDTGKLEESNNLFVEKIAGLPTPKRRWAAFS